MLTNNKNTPAIMLDVLDDRPYLHAGGADYSATSLVMSPRQLQLKKRYGHQVVDDAMDRWALFLGNACHEYIERKLALKPDQYIVERKMTEFINGRKVVAKIDAYDAKNKILYDHKTGTQWDWTSDHKKEYEQQLNINAWFLRQEGYEVERCCLNMLTKDWSAGMAKYKGAEDFPPNPMFLVDVPVWSEQEQEDFIKARLDLHIEAEDMADEELPRCTDHERWAKDSTFAVKAPNVYKAKRVLSTREDAEQWLASNGHSGWYIEERPGDCVRCSSYCNVNKFCSQYKEAMTDVS